MALVGGGLRQSSSSAASTRRTRHSVPPARCAPRVALPPPDWRAVACRALPTEAARALKVLEAYYEQAGDAKPSAETVSRLSAESSLSPAQIARWFSRRAAVAFEDAQQRALEDADAAAQESSALREAAQEAEQSSEEGHADEGAAAASGLDVADEAGPASDDPAQSEGRFGPVPPPPPPPPLREEDYTDDMRRMADKIDWKRLTPQAREIVESSLKPRKIEWLVESGKPVPGAKGKVHEGPWIGGDPKLGWTQVPDTMEMPRLDDGTLVEWTNVNTKQPHQRGYLPVDLDPPDVNYVHDVLWDDMEQPEDVSHATRVDHENWQRQGRLPLEDVHVGQLVQGFVACQHLYFGAYIDFGGQYDGLVYIGEKEWPHVRHILDLGKRVTCRVRRILDPVRFRWPVELSCVSPDVSFAVRRRAPMHPAIWIYTDETYMEAAIAAGRPMRPEVDEEAILEEVRKEVRENFVAPPELRSGTAAKPPKAAAVAKSARVEEAIADEEEDELADDDMLDGDDADD